MPLYRYEGVDKAGNKVKDQIEAGSRLEAIRKLRQLGLTITKIEKIKKRTDATAEGGKEGEKPWWQKELTLSFGGVSSKDLSIFSKQLAALIEAGIGLVDALELVADSIDNSKLKKELLKMAEEIRGGIPFSKALQERRKLFDEFFISMVEVGEETGQLDMVLKRASDYYKRIAEIINKIKSASFYPAFVSIAATLITLGIIYFLVPTFAQIYKSLGGELPALTQMLINISNSLREYTLYFFGGTAAVVTILVLLYKRVYGFKKFVHLLQLKIPMFGTLFVKGALAKFSRTFATLFAAGVSIERSLELSAKVTGNVVYQEAIESAKEAVIQGEPLWSALQRTERFPKMLISMIKIGEETGQLDSMLESLADFYEDELKTTIDGLISMIEPMMMVIIGGIVGFILVALYLPIFELGELIH